jgi:hypothetical protein
MACRGRWGEKTASGNVVRVYTVVHEFRAFQRREKRRETRGEFHLRAIETRGHGIALDSVKGWDGGPLLLVSLFLLTLLSSLLFTLSLHSVLFLVYCYYSPLHFGHLTHLHRIHPLHVRRRAARTAA